MVYLLAIATAAAFLYSPKVEKTGKVFVAQPLVISQERKSPAYYLFQQTQLALKKPTREPAQDLTPSVHLNGSQSSEIGVTYVQPMVLNRVELSEQTDQELKKIAQKQTDSTLLSKINFSDAISRSTQAQNPAQRSSDSALFLENPSEKLKQSPLEGATIRGQFELTEGVAIVDHIVTLQRIFEGQSVELGQVDLKAGMYQIQVGSFEGELVAEVKDRSGVIIGEDRQRILGLKQSGKFFSGPLLKLGQPSAFALNPRNVDDKKIAENAQNASFFSGHHTLKKTTDTYSNVASLSSTVGLISDKTGGNATTLSLRLGKDKSETLLFSQKWVDGVVSYLSEKVQIQYLPEPGIIIGRILQDGKPVAGAQVVVENQPGLEPYYLDQFLIPQMNQNVTSTNGFFILPGLQSGAYQISAFLKERHLGSQLYYVDSNVVSYQEILSTLKTQSVLVRAFDAFTSEPMDAEILLPGREDMVEVSEGTTRYRTASEQGLQSLIVRPLNRNYADYIYLQNNKKDHLHLPFVLDAWLDQLKRSAQIPSAEDASLFIGFVPQGNYDLFLSLEAFDRKNIIYFNSQGLITPTPVPGGGFIIYNLASGLQEIILQDQSTERTYSQVVIAEPGKTYLSHFVD